MTEVGVWGAEARGEEEAGGGQQPPASVGFVPPGNEAITLKSCPKACPRLLQGCANIASAIPVYRKIHEVMQQEIYP